MLSIFKMIAHRADHVRPPVERESVMPITEFLHGLRFDPETKRAMGVAFKRTCAARVSWESRFIAVGTSGTNP